MYIYVRLSRKALAMLLSFSVENYRSFKNEQTLSLIASKRLGETSQSPHCVEVPGADESALRIAAIYGANGAGKTNLVRALLFMERLVIRGTSPGKRIAYEPFLLGQDTQNKPSCFELQILEGGQVFRYGFGCDGDRIHEEWLSFYEGKKERSVFTRTTSEQGAVTVELGASADDTGIPPRLKALEQVGARPNQLFLTEVVNLDDPEAQGFFCRQVIKWFTSTLSIIRADAPFMMLAETIATNEAFADFAGQFLNEASTGIAGLKVQTNEIPRSKASIVPSELWEEIDKDLNENDVALLHGPDGEELFVDGSNKDLVKIRQIKAIHGTEQGGRALFPLHEESDGSQRLLNLLPALYRLKAEAGVFVIDELERSMHPILARKFIEFFLKGACNRNSQMIFTTHESTLLDLDILRRDGIWFTEKNESGATHLYSLAEFNVRKDLRIDKGYLQGRFGAIPFLGGIDHLIEKESRTEEPK
jgi:AAA15 family ATPase/GTPase